MQLPRTISPDTLAQSAPCRHHHAVPRTQARAAQTALPAGALQEVETELSASGARRVVYQRKGWRRWTFDGKYSTNYIATGTRGPILVLIHGFGASAYHYRYNIPELARSHRVFSLCLLGFGWSDKPLVQYSDYAIWVRQVQDFIREVVRPGDERVVLAGNSLGGYVALATATAQPAAVKGVVLLNAAGRFQDVKETLRKEVETAVASENGGAPLAQGVNQAVEGTSQPRPSGSGSSGGGSSGGMNSAYRTYLKSGNEGGAGGEEDSLVTRVLAPFKTLAQRTAVFVAFMAAKQPSRIRQVLEQVYYDKANLDQDLVDSISEPAKDPNAAEVFYRIITGRGEPVNVLLDRLQGTPLLLLWGRHDPWIRPETAQRITSLYPAAQTVFVEGGHCPMDDAPQATNEALVQWVSKL